MDDVEKPVKIRKTNPRETAACISKTFFCWLIPTFIKGVKNEFSEDDLDQPLSDDESRQLGDKLEAAWNIEQTTYKNPLLTRAIVRVFGKELAFFGLLVFISELVIKISQPILIGKLLTYYMFTPSDEKAALAKRDAYFYSGGLVLANFLTVMLVHSYMLGLQHVGMKIRVAICSLIYRKTLRLSKNALAKTTIGQMVNLLSNDVNRFDLAVSFIHHLWVAPLLTIIVLGLLYVNLGYTAVVGIGVLLCFVPLQFLMGKKSSTARLRTAQRTDNRVRLMNEVISGIQVIKMYAWEKSFAELIETARKREISQIQVTSYVRAINVSFVIFLSKLAVFVCIVYYVLSGNTLQAPYVYMLTSFYNVVNQTLTQFFPLGVILISEARVSIQRLKQFLQHDEVNKSLSEANSPESVHPDTKSTEDCTAKETDSNAIEIKNVYAKWTESHTTTLHNLSLTVRRHQLVAVVGAVGCGKTSLLHAILKELPIISGKLCIDGKVSYASQEPWLFGSTIRQNIVFTSSMDKEKYNEIVKVCCLKEDFEQFPQNDCTVVGDRGVMLSGGQKARINLARAVYNDAEIYLLDDPLSAVDSAVGKQLFEQCICGYLRNKSTILVTHQLQYLKCIDCVYVIDNGQITAQGKYEDLVRSGIDFLNLIASNEESQEQESIPESSKRESISEDGHYEGVNSREVREHMSHGTVSTYIYTQYFKAAGNAFVTGLAFLTFPLTQYAASSCDIFLSYWVNLYQNSSQPALNHSIIVPNDNLTAVMNSNEFPLTNTNCLIIYSILLCLVVLLTLMRSLSFFKLCMRASKKLHNNMFRAVVNAPMKFFHTNATGRILNRFAKDIGAADEVLPLCIIDTCQISLIVLSIALVIGYVNPWMLVPTVVVLVLFYLIRLVFLATSRNVKRLEGTCRSPVFSHITASLNGLTTIRAFRSQNKLQEEFDRHQDLHSSAFYTFLGCTRTFGFWLDFNCIVYTALVTFSFLIFNNETFAGNVGLAITQAISLTGMLQWGMRQWSELENQMTSVERVLEYTALKSERNENELEDKYDSKVWITQGQIDFEQLCLRYAVNEPFVLKHLTFTIHAKEKVGIVGRTGAGKTSLITALFRLAPLEGRILIDGFDTQKMSLTQLRSAIAIIPQEPVLFSGTLRKNLDPFENFSDEQLWTALREVELKSLVHELPMGLNSTVAEGGVNFSVGQRQLLCLARAIVRNNKILVLDEATASVDPKTDELIQQAIRRKFEECTVLTIAHRLHTVMDSDRILVMDNGHAVEFDSPYVLLSQDRGILKTLVQKTGSSTAQFLLDIAKTKYDKTITCTKL